MERLVRAKDLLEGELRRASNEKAVSPSSEELPQPNHASPSKISAANTVSPDTASALLEALRTSRETLQTEYDALVSAHDALTKRHEDHLEGHAALSAAQDDLTAKQMVLRAKYDKLCVQHRELRSAHDTLAAQLSVAATSPNSDGPPTSTGDAPSRSIGAEEVRVLRKRLKTVEERSADMEIELDRLQISEANYLSQISVLSKQRDAAIADSQVVLRRRSLTLFKVFYLSPLPAHTHSHLLRIIEVWLVLPLLRTPHSFRLRSCNCGKRMLT